MKTVRALTTPTQLLKSATLSFRLVYIKRHTNPFSCYCVALVSRLLDDAAQRSLATLGCTSLRLRRLRYRRCFRLGKHYTDHVGCVHLEYPHSNVHLILSCCIHQCMIELTCFHFNNIDFLDFSTLIS